MGDPNDLPLAFLRCPSCKESLKAAEGEFQCVQCASHWPVVNGVPSFVASSPYWGEPGMTPEVMRQMIEHMGTQSWHRVMGNHTSPEVRARYGIASDLSRADWHKLVGLRQDSIVLDLGAGLGGTSQAISRSCGRVYAVEQVQERAEFMKLRFGQESCKNVTVIKASADSLPFGPNSFDLIVLNGVLEWLPLSRRSENPRKAQLYYLRLFQNLLRPGGTLYVGIENRTAYNLLLGAPDPHILIKYVAVLPRWVADLICRYKINDRYRNYLYSHAGYRKLMLDAGFGSVRIFAAIPSYYHAQKLLDLTEKSDKFVDDIWLTKNPLSRVVKKVMTQLDFVKYFGNAYIIFARK